MLMKKLLTVLTLSLVLAAGAAIAQPYYVAGDFQGWDATTHQMFDDGTNGDAVSGDGIHSLLATVEFAGRHEWKAAEFGWAASWPGSGNSWFYTSADNEAVLFTFNVNTAGDGWLPDGYWPHTDHSEALTLVGSLQDELGDIGDWNNAGGLILHDDGVNGDAAAGDGYFTYSGSLPAGYYEWKIVRNGTWDSISSDGTSVNGPNNVLDLADPCIAYFVLNASLGRYYAGCEAPVGNEEMNWSDIKGLYR